MQELVNRTGHKIFIAIYNDEFKNQALKHFADVIWALLYII